MIAIKAPFLFWDQCNESCSANVVHEPDSGVWPLGHSVLPLAAGVFEWYVRWRIPKHVLDRRLDSVAAAVKGGSEDPLDNEEQMADQLDAIPFLCRFQYRPTADFLLAFMQPLSTSYKDAAVPGASRSSSSLFRHPFYCRHCVVV